ncbi:MAG: tetratricopeptide repeat protein [Victivallales bacterium]|nr:tetratricopeptide repeat protein [Victivallales bacterium]
MKTDKWRLICITTCLLTAACLVFSQDDGGKIRNSIFDMPKQHEELTRYSLMTIAAARAGRFGEAEKIIRQAVALYPDASVTHYNLACMLALQGKTEDALNSLEESIEKGFRDARHIREDNDLSSLRGCPEFKSLIEKAEKLSVNKEEKIIPPGKIKDGIALISEANTIWNPSLAVFMTAFAPPPDSVKKAPAVKGYGKLGDMIRAWVKDGKAAGNYGDLYDNRDNKHSSLACERFPQLTATEYAPEAKERKLDVGLQSSFIFNRPTIGNSSTAITSGWIWRSLPRLAMVRERDMAISSVHYRSGHLYFYPEHRDYDEQHGDLFPANHPYHMISQGSSGSDKPFMEAIACILASFQPETKTRLYQTGMLMPTVQLVFRRNLKEVENDEDYLSGKAHPAVFEKGSIDNERMAMAANSIVADNLPPVSVVQLLSFKPALGGVEMIAEPNSELLFQTPQAISLVFRRLAKTWTFEVTAQGSADVEGKKVEYAWRLLQGPPDKVKIEPGGNGSSAKITVSWFTPFPISPGSNKKTRRIDIGCFVNDGTQWSPPAFITVVASAREERKYHEDGKIASVDYSGNADIYDDPLVFPTREWKDEFHYTDDGDLKGWTRTAGKEKKEYSHHGFLVESTDKIGRPLLVRQTSYHLPADDTGRRLLPQIGEKLFKYVYQHDGDWQGQPTPEDKN